MRSLAIVAGLSGFAGCDAASPSLGLDAVVRVEGAQWRPGPLPTDGGGPPVVSALALRPVVAAGTVGEPLTVTLGAGATGLLVGRAGDPGAWIVPAGAPRTETPDLPSAAVAFDVADDAAPGPLTLEAVAVDGEGRPGAATTVALIVDEPDDTTPPAGELVLELRWTGSADLDLHVVDPTGVEVWQDNPSSWTRPPPGAPPDPDGWRRGGLLDHDANADCRLEGRPRERVTWTAPPPSGEYTVRVETSSLCDSAVAYWYVAVWRGGQVLASAAGVSTPADTVHRHGAGAGALALRALVP